MAVVEREAEEKRGKRKKRAGKGKVSWKGFLSCAITDTQKKEIPELVASGDLTPEMVFEVVNHSYKFGVNYYAVDDCFVATFMDTDVESPFAGWMLSGWGATPQKACVALLFRHLYVWRDGWQLDQGGGAVGEYA